MSFCNINENIQNYKIFNKLGSGGFGSIYKCIDISPNSNSEEYAIKIEPISSKQLETESKLLNYLKGGIGIPKVISYFKYKSCNCLVMELLGKNLEQIFIQHQKTFTLQEIKEISLQILSRIEFLHLKNLIHCDIKPTNFAYKNGLIYLIDYGITKKFICSKTQKHIAWGKVSNKTRGTIKYCSINSHLGYTLSRRDDLISFIYMLIYFYVGFLPWENKNDEDALDIKLNISDIELCFNLPKNIRKMWEYIKQLKFQELPDYNFLKNMIVGLTNVNCREKLSL